MVGFVADRMHCYLQPGAIRTQNMSLHLAFRDHLAVRQARSVRRIQVRLEEERRCRSQGAIGEALQRADVQLLTAKVRTQTDSRQALPRGQRLVTGDAYRQL